MTEDFDDMLYGNTSILIELNEEGFTPPELMASAFEACLYGMAYDAERMGRRVLWESLMVDAKVNNGWFHVDTSAVSVSA